MQQRQRAGIVQLPNVDLLALRAGDINDLLHVFSLQRVKRNRFQAVRLPLAYRTSVAWQPRLAPEAHAVFSVGYPVYHRINFMTNDNENPMSYRVIALDLDGTLLDNQNASYRNRWKRWRRRAPPASVWWWSPAAIMSPSIRSTGRCR